MKNFRIIFALAWLLTISSHSLVLAELKIIRLNYARPEEIISTITQIFAGNVNVAPAPSINAIVINSEDSKLLEEIEKLVSELDRRPNVLRFSVQRLADETTTSQHFQPGRHINHRHQHKTESKTNSVVVMENRKARITDDTIRIFSYPTYFGETVQAITTSQGLMVSGRVTGNQTVQLEVWYSSGEELDSETLLTMIEAPLGEWISLGGIDTETRRHSPSFKLGKNAEFSVHKNGGQIDRRYLLKVDLVP